MKNYLYLILSISLVLFSSCNGDEGKVKTGPVDPAVPDGEIKTALTLESLSAAGREGWQQFLFNKKITMRNPAAGNPSLTKRYIEFDGFSLHFLSDSTFYEKNAFGVTYLEGKYKVQDKSTVELRYQSKDTGKDTIVHRTIDMISNMRLTTRYNYVTPSDSKYDLEAEDIRVFRNTKTMPSQHPGVTKVVVNHEKLKGKWIIKSYKIYEDGRQTNEKEEPLVLGNLFEFDDGNYKEVGHDGVVHVDDGRYAIVDDVVHIFYKELDENNQLVDKASTLWIDRWNKDGNVEELRIYDDFMIAIKGQESRGIVLINTITWVTKAQ